MHLFCIITLLQLVLIVQFIFVSGSCKEAEKKAYCIAFKGSECISAQKRVNFTVDDYYYGHVDAPSRLVIGLFENNYKDKTTLFHLLSLKTLELYQLPEQLN